LLDAAILLGEEFVDEFDCKNGIIGGERSSFLDASQRR